MTQLERVLYTAKAHTTDGQDEVLTDVTHSPSANLAFFRRRMIAPAVSSSSTWRRFLGASAAAAAFGLILLPFPATPRLIRPRTLSLQSPGRSQASFAQQTRTTRSALSGSTFRKPQSPTSAGAWWRHDGPTRRLSLINPKACNWRRSRR
jgi:hypothetical protein